MPEALTEDAVLSFLDAYRDAYEKGEDRFFSYFTDDASFFTVSSPVRIDSREEFKRSFSPAFTSGMTRRSQFMAPEIRILGDYALVTCHNRISVGDQVTNLRATFLVVLRDGALKIAHLHNSAFPLPGVPAAAASAKDLEEFTVLEERVASAAAQVGTPK
ncbi:nuclear transport factor 2 family protein [Streptomyces sp. NPDC058678]|uniref:nuclear transport factor 2 family protein n=1 Tax=Streptomyces sp. NPDC058678 TaxID=3346595 RepID=UPI00364D4284